MGSLGRAYIHTGILDSRDGSSSRSSWLPPARKLVFPRTTSAFVAPSASITGDVQVGQRSSVGYGCVLRGHSAVVSVVHGCTIEDVAVIGMGATLLDGVAVDKHAMVAAGALVRQNSRIPSEEVWGGNPTKFLRKLTDEEIAFISHSATNYFNLAVSTGPCC